MKKNVFIVILLVLLICTAVSATGCIENKFIGIEKKNNDLYYLNFSVLDKEKNHSLQLMGENELEVEIVRYQGEINLTINDEDGNILYTGNCLETCSFVVGTQNAKMCVIKVSGKKGEGIVTVKVC